MYKTVSPHVFHALLEVEDYRWASVHFLTWPDGHRTIECEMELKDGTKISTGSYPEAEEEGVLGLDQSGPEHASHRDPGER